MLIDKNMNIIPETGFNEYDISAKENISLHLSFRNSCNVLIHLHESDHIEIEADVQPNIEATLVFWNESERKTATKETYTIEKNGNLTIAYGECNAASAEKDIKVLLKDSYAKAHLTSASLVTSDKKFNQIITNQAKHTMGNISNYAVVLKEGSLMIDAIGKIENGASKSQSHQVSRALSFEEGQKTTILPELLIDENDVQASHAMSIGRVDEEQLYYMMSRGLTIKQCTMLISLGYLLPITEYISDEKLRNVMKEELERKINKTCLM